MPDAAHLVALALLLSMVAYIVTGGADFGGGVWELFARGPRRQQQVAALRHAIAPIWEANHVWLILIVVLLFVCFPAAFAAIMVALHVPVTLLLFGIVLRGAAFAFQAYAQGDAAVERHAVRWFRAGSVVTPCMLGITAGAVAAGDIRVDLATGAVTTDFVSSWLAPFPFLVGLMTLLLCAFLAAVYMTIETAGALQQDFRRRALLAGTGVGVLALPSALVALNAAPAIGVPLLTSAWALPFHAGTGLIAIAALWALWQQRFQLARALAVAQTALILSGWAMAQYPFVLAPDLSIERAAAAPAVLTTTLVVLAGGTVVLVPALLWLYRVFKSAA